MIPLIVSNISIYLLCKIDQENIFLFIFINNYNDLFYRDRKSKSLRLDYNKKYRIFVMRNVILER